MAVSTANPQAQRYFDEGFAWNNGFYHAEAIRAFRAAQQLDPECAMCFWGEALALGPNINMPMVPEAVAPALAAIRQAQALAARATPKEQALIAALAKRYGDGAERAELDRAYATAMRGVVQAFPDDPETGTLFVESLMDVQPWDYWEADRRTPRGGAAEAIATTRRILAADPNHPVAIHLYIHLMEASVDAEQAEAAAGRLGALMPTSGHLVHMPAHIYYKLGRYGDSIASNEAAARADEAIFAENGDRGLYGSSYYAHNVHFVMVSALMAGKVPTALAAADKLASIVDPAIVRAVPPLQAIDMAPFFAYAQLGEPARILGLPDPGDGIPLTKAAWHYARGVAFAESGRAAEALAEAQALAAIGQTRAMDELAAWYVPGRDILQIGWHVINGRVAQNEGRLGDAEAQLRAAAAIQDALPYMEPPYWYYPVRQTLAAVLLARGRPAEAADAFTESLVQAPNNAWSLWGLAQAQRAMGDAAAAEVTTGLFEKAWSGDADGPAMRRL
jgi:tetratricopeptide (TPR) repeat protein